MNIGNKFLLAGDKFMPEMHLKQRRFTYSACGAFTQNKEKIQKFKETGDITNIYRKELDRDLARKRASDKVLRDKAFNIAKMQNMMDINEDWLLWFIDFLI